MGIRWALVGLMVMLSGCQEVYCVETLSPPVKAVYGLPLMAVAFATAWGGLGLVRRILHRLGTPLPTRSRSQVWVAVACAVLVGLGGAATLMRGAEGPLLLGATGLQVALLLGAGLYDVVARRAVGVGRVVGAAVFTVLLGTTPVVLTGINAFVVVEAGRECSPSFRVEPQGSGRSSRSRANASR